MFGEYVVRKNSGSMLVLITSITVALVLAVIIFSYNYVRLFASQGQSKNAIDAAALAAAGDLSRIVVNTKEYGYVSLSDSAPTGPVTEATDKYYLPVRGINSLIATCRLENQLAIAMKDPVLSALAQYDLTQAQSAITQLRTALTASLLPKGKGQDIYGNDVTPYEDAEAAFKANDMRQGQQYVNSSLILTLGALSKPVPTNIPVPQPTSLGGLQPSQSQGGFYLSDTPVPFGNGSAVYGSQNVTLAAIAQSTRLVDPKTFTAQVNGITADKQMLSVVKAVANEQVTDSQNTKGLNLNMASCAIPANNFDPRPAPGALSISFPDGPVSDWKKPSDMLTDPQLAQNLTDLQQATGGDYPTDNNANVNSMNSFWISQQPTEANIARVCVYDWVRRAGPKANIQSIIDGLNMTFNTTSPVSKDWWTYTAASPSVAVDISKQASNNPQILQGVIHIYKFNADGTVSYSSKNLTPWPYAVLSENQMFGESLGGYTSSALQPIVFNFTTPVSLYSQQNQSLLGRIFGFFDSNGKANVSTCTFSQYFDVYFRDEVRQPGNKIGGQHGGEPLNNTQVAMSPAVRRSICNVASNVLHGTGTDYGAGGSGAWGSNGHGGGQHGSGPPGGNGGSGQHGQGPGGNTGGWGGGATPMIEPQSDFGETSYPAAPYTTFSTGSGQVRPTYTTNGTAIDIRFRRQITVNQQMSQDLSQVSDIGYLGYLGK